MTYQIVRAADHRETATPNAVMTTLASPTLGGSAHLSQWRVVMAAGAQGPLHTMDSEQIWTVESGTAVCAVGGHPVELAVGDTLRLAAGAERQFSTTGGAQFVVSGFAAAIARTAENADGVVPPWIA